MMADTDNVLREWLTHHPLSDEENRRVDQWLWLAERLEVALEIEEAYEAQLDGRGQTTPDLVECIGIYGTVRAIVDGWRDLPVAPPQQELGRWREAGYLPTLEEVLDHCAGVAGGVLELLGRDADKGVGFIEVQSRTLLTSYSQRLAKGATEYEPQDWTEDEISDGDGEMERRGFDEPFTMRDTLEGFGRGLERLRLLTVTEAAEHLSLPNWVLYARLEQIDLNDFWREVAAQDHGLRQIVTKLRARKYTALLDPLAPSYAWWRT